MAKPPTAEQLADAIVVALEQGRYLDGKLLDRNRMLQLIDQARQFSKEELDAVLRRVLRANDPEKSDAEIERVIAGREEAILAVLRRLRS